MRGSISARGLDAAVASLQVLGGDLSNKALADALNHTANQANSALLDELDEVLDNPTSFTRNADIAPPDCGPGCVAGAGLPQQGQHRAHPEAQLR
ncbi:hypothetical protein N7714_03540 [Pseudomonas aeruginosa]|uniref:hypothetical protein n=1 Tax=Pseudomonas TaxID=286 RepID=UPI000A4C2742|nr:MULTISPECIES: hypothetical protein [Pseudomonas]MCC0144332.1 hypothetical protein [Pseudomonas aeruginosa]MCT1017493.1 hypothetical protein [Pseudomonas aeruginosa]MCT5882822.1 hypothetical protein [Pseudomonas aeruginosa]MCV4347544.1 hypothetical protein [Pseudomonas aeruginosa]MDG9801987.1 hypothetical protein [Pseudomonas aeruginosa]